MVGFMTSRRALAVSAAFITAGIFAFLLATSPTWRAVMGSGLPWSSETAAPKTADDSMPAPQTAVPGSARVASVPGPVAAAPPATPAATDPPKPTETGAAQEPIRQPEGPSFDIVRVDPNGESVIAARAKPGADIVLLDGGKPIAHAKADASGQVAFLPPTLSPGEHSLMLSVGEPNSPAALSSQSVAVSVPVQPTAPPMVALIQPDQPAQVLSGPVAGSGAPDVNQSGSASATTAAVPAVAISAIEVEDLGSFYASGKAAPGSHCRVYLNGSFVATVTAGKDGVWSLKIRRGMKPGHYVVRADQVEAADGKVQARAEVPFDYPARAAKAISLLRPKPGQTASPAGTMPGANSQTLASGVTKPAIPTDQVASNDPSSASLLANGQSPSLPKAGSTNAVSGVASSKPATGGSVATKVANADAVSASNPGATVIAQLLTTKVVHGDSLWRISRKILGHGERYTQIYAANTTQIRDPRLIYPGQIFVMPQLAVP